MLSPNSLLDKRLVREGPLPHENGSVLVRSFCQVMWRQIPQHPQSPNPSTIEGLLLLTVRNLQLASPRKTMVIVTMALVFRIFIS